MGHRHRFLCITSVLLQPLAGMSRPGTAAECWQAGFTYERCCLRSFGPDATCFPPGYGFDETSCCSGLLQALLAAQHRGDDGPSRAEASWLGVRRCAERSKEEAASEPASLVGNEFLKTLTCIASLPSVDIVMDTFLGGGFSCKAIATGLATSKPRKRPPTVLAFEMYKDRIDSALKLLNEVPLPLKSPIVADIVKEEGENIPLSIDYKEKLYRYQSDLLEALQSAPVLDKEPLQMVFAHGTPLARRSLRHYAWNALDIACQHLAPVDLVVIDQDFADVTKEWFIIETVCRPRLVALFNVNIHGGGGWIKYLGPDTADGRNRLEILDNWQLEAKGVLKLGDSMWLSMTEVRRLRAWTIFSNLAVHP
ncbi:unnamed protein product [Symbiodinium microadriaticum]|nr:unnamed protein product [Symbiodinium microadriaticum]